MSEYDRLWKSISMMNKFNRYADWNRRCEQVLAGHQAGQAEKEMEGPVIELVGVGKPLTSSSNQPELTKRLHQNGGRILE